ncbi:MAG: HemK2/MTQ2 family protein methyltransferase [Thermoplasmata archaeon]|jgi:release factor glutamine methyltransferase
MGDVPPERSIYPIREDTLLLRPYAEADPGRWFLEIGTGNGLLALTAARRGARTVATDLNRGALRQLATRARAERLPLVAVRTDLANGLGRFDRIVANPPYLPTPLEGADPDPDDRLALDGGPDGCRVSARIVDALDEHLRPGGRAYLLVSSVQAAEGLERIRDGYCARGGRIRTVAERRLEGERLEVWEFRPA